MLVLGVANHPPDYMFRMLQKRNSANSVLFVSDQDKLKTTKRSHIFFLNALALRRNLEQVNLPKFGNKIGFVFDSPLALQNLNILFADFKRSESIHTEGFEIGSLDMSLLSSDPFEVRYEPRDFTDEILERIESFIGILTPFMTFIYTMPSATHQKPVKELACSWLVSDRTEQELLRDLESLNKHVPLNEKQIRRFIDLVTSENARVYKSALSAARGLSERQGSDFQKIANDFKVSPYEMRYILSVYDSVKQ